ncbi:MAG: ABC transporter ATP-binding protein [Thermodesulfovibrionia bacterium]
MAQLEVIDITKVYQIGGDEIKAVDGVSFNIERGEFVSIVGHSGSGKTTLISLIGGLLRPTSGKVLFEGIDIFSLDDNTLSEYRNEKIGYMFQFTTLIPTLTVVENVMLPSLFRLNKRASLNHNVESLVELVGLGDKKDLYPSQLSGGQQRRVAIVRALVNEPDIILADEPTGDLDEETEKEVMHLFRELNERKGVTIILITHDIELSRQARRHLRMINGRLFEE